MADPAGLALAIFGAVCELYKVSMATYTLYVDVKNFPHSFKNLRLALKIERMRLKTWAQCMGIDPGSDINERIRGDSELLDLIKEILTNMSDAFQDSVKMLEDYSEVHDQSELQEDDKPELLRRISPGASAKRFVQTYGRLVKWGAFDKKKLEHLVQSLNVYNDKLYKLATPAEESSLRRLMRTQFVVSTRSKDLQLVQEAAAMTGLDDLEREASSKAFVREVYMHEDLCSKLEATKLKAIVQSDPVLPETMNSWKFDIERFHYKGVALMANHSRTLGTYTYPGGEKIPILVDWSRCADDSWRIHNREAFEIRLNNLARVLNRDVLPHGFHVLQCLGYIFASSTTIGYVFRPPANTASDAAPVSLHDLLSKTKSTADFPELGTRYQLAKAVTTTLYEFHNIGWLHKNIHPGNILFFHSKATPETTSTLNLRKPYLVGFDLSRSNQPGEITEKPIASESEDLYRHPNYRGRNATDFKPTYDYFSLGIVLFEIALWKLASGGTRRDSETSRRTSGSGSWINSTGIFSEPPRRASGSRSMSGAGRRISGSSLTDTVLDEESEAVRAFSESRSASTPNAGHKPSLSSPVDPDSISKTIRDKAADLGRFVGARYRDAVLACVSMELDAVWEGRGEYAWEDKEWEEKEEDGEEDAVEDRKGRGRELALQKAVQKMVVDGIELCQA